MNKIYNITNHKLSREQIPSSFVVVEMPDEVRASFGQVGPEEVDVARALATVLLWLRDATPDAGDILAVQGHMGVCFPLVNTLLKKGLCPVYAATERIAVETVLPDGSVVKKSVFQHLGWNRYML